MTGTLAAALEARGVKLEVGAEHHETAKRVHDFHAGFCPVARTLEASVRIETELGFAG